MIRRLERPSGARLSVDLSRGGAVRDLRLVPEGSREGALAVLDDGSSSEESARWFCGRLLVPFNDRIPRGEYRWQGRFFQLPPNDPDGTDAIHGFLYETPLKALKIQECSRESVLFLEGALEPREGYPFPLFLEVTYTLRDDSLLVDLLVKNTGPETAPVALGWHPYFSLPEADRVDRLALEIPAPCYYQVDRDLIPTGETPSVEGSPRDFRTPRLIGDDEIDLAWPLDGSPRDGSRVVLHGVRHRLELWCDDAFGTVQVFIPPHRRSIALEPVTGPADAFNRPVAGSPGVLPGAFLRGRARVRLRPSTQEQTPAMARS
ncbi:hypothetical protein AU468_10705 [Alkalispirochaeta sphaeroplastigenens]|uniref:Aldose epimerase n=1 Tax=Alkalispirochaeta sphaeroplastigenens TaxID=1187066 RepID=A0A2S4JHY5_9SPIO|nr:hypothetical protein [Alkalispirochaeta sphaeroplastigenens]POQ99079.1 hypothetical protein AU468_10705 [Alkalispirochaeta sphaeroplastigenens]